MSTALSNIVIPLLLGTANARRQATPANVIYDEYVKRRPNLSQEQQWKIGNKQFFDVKYRAQDVNSTH